MSFEEENKINRLEELHDSNYQIVDGEPDISGWAVLDGQGRIVGAVEDVLFDPQSHEVRYIILDLSENKMNIDVDKKVLIPIGIAELRDQYGDDSTENKSLTTLPKRVPVLSKGAATYDDEVVYLPSVSAERLLALPAYEKGALSTAAEAAIRSVFEEATTDIIGAPYEGQTFYAREHFRNKIYPKNESEDVGRQDRKD